MVDYLEHTPYPRDGYRLELGRLWELGTGSNTLRELAVVATATDIRIRDMYCGEWEDAERNALHLTVDQARALGEVLLAAAEEVERFGPMWQSHACQADPGPALDRALDEQWERTAENLRNLAEWEAKAKAGLE